MEIKNKKTKKTADQADEQKGKPSKSCLVLDIPA
jgi:hypothetical protein